MSSAKMTSILLTARLCVRGRHALASPMASLYCLSAGDDRGGRLPSNLLSSRPISFPLISPMKRDFFSTAKNQIEGDGGKEGKEGKNESTRHWIFSSLGRRLANINANNEITATLNKPLGLPLDIAGYKVQVIIRHAVVGFPVVLLLLFGSFCGFGMRMLLLAVILAGMAL